MPLGAGAGWLTGKALEMNGNAVLKEAQSIVEWTQQYVQSQRSKYEDTRNRLISKLETFSAVLSAKLGRTPQRIAENRTQLPPDLEASWQRISANATMAFPSFRDLGIGKSGWDSRINGTIAVANSQVRSGHPLFGAAITGIATARRGFEFRDACGNSRNEARAAAFAACQGADQALQAILDDVEQIERDWEESITPKLNAALTDNNPDLMIHLAAWAERVETRARSWVVTDEQ